MNEELILRIQNVQDAAKEREVVYAAMDELGINYKRTNCKRCLNDYLNMVKEELGLIESAAEVSDFNVEDCGHKYRYLKSRAVSWCGHIMDQNTDEEIIREFLKMGPRGYYLVVK